MHLIISENISIISLEHRSLVNGFVARRILKV